MARQITDEDKFKVMDHLRGMVADIEAGMTLSQLRDSIELNTGVNASDHFIRSALRHLGYAIKGSRNRSGKGTPRPTVVLARAMEAVIGYLHLHCGEFAVSAEMREQLRTIAEKRRIE